MARERGLRWFWEAKTRLAKLPGVYKAYSLARDLGGEGRVYQLRFGHMRGLRWKRFGRLPLWYHLGIWEPHVSDLLVEHLRPGDTFWDLGANAGFHTLLGAKIVGPSGHVVGVEPNPEMADICETQVQLNAFADRTVIERVAVGASAGVLAFTRTENPLMGGLADYVHESGADTFDVQCVTMDMLLERHAAPDLIKSDVEGAEVAALEGAERLLSEMGPRLLFSVHDDEAADACRAILERHGYRTHRQAGFGQMMICIKKRG